MSYIPFSIFDSQIRGVVIIIYRSYEIGCSCFALSKLVKFQRQYLIVSNELSKNGHSQRIRHFKMDTQAHAPRLKKEDDRHLGQDAFFIFSIEYVLILWTMLLFSSFYRIIFKKLHKKVNRTMKKRHNTWSRRRRPPWISIWVAWLLGAEFLLFFWQRQFLNDAKNDRFWTTTKDSDRARVFSD